MRVESLGDYYTLHGAAEVLGRSYGQVWRTVQQQQVPTLTLGRTLLVTLDDLRPALERAGLAAKAPVQKPLPSAPASAPGFRVRGQQCPECGSFTLASQGGCQVCLACGYSVC